MDDAAFASRASVSDEDVQSRKQQRSSPLYQGRVEVYAKAVTGTFRSIKWWSLIGLLAIYYIAPWLRWNRGTAEPDQAILVDMDGGRLYFFWIEIWPQEVYYLTGILVLAAFGLFLATALFGRLWCGFACPQTVWTDLFMLVERWIEGDRNARMRFDKQRFSRDKALRKVGKHAIWLVIALLTGGAWAMYFQDAPTFVVQFFTGQSSFATYFFVGLFTATTYLLAGMAREQVCTYMCPWPRIQGALVDQDTMAVTYEAWRGEPRGKHKAGASWEGRGHCIDCKQCVAVCPMGIDIRDGFQLECIGCGLCIDACDSVMEKVGLPPKLIAYDSERNQELREVGEKEQYRIVRTRTVLYAIILTLVAGIMLFALTTRSNTDVNIIPERNPLFVTLSDGSIRNAYDLKIMNKAGSERSFELTFIDPDLERAGGFSALGQSEPSDSLTLLAPPDGIGNHRVFIRLPASALQGDATEIELVLTDTVSGTTTSIDTIFRGPAQ